MNVSISRILSTCLMALVLLSCAAQTGQIVKSRDFSLSKDTRIAVQCDQAPGFGMGLESRLLSLGYEVVPYEVAIDAISSDASASVEINESGAEFNSKTSTYAARYVPAGVSINLRVRLHQYPAATYFLGGFVRIIDLSDKRLLASFEYKGSEWTLYSENALLESFMKDFIELTE